MSKLEFKPQDRQSIDFAEQERKKTKEKGQIVRENFNGRLVFEEQNSSSNSVYFAEIDCYSGRFEINRKNKENQTIENIVKIDLTDKKINKI